MALVVSLQVLGLRLLKKSLNPIAEKHLDQYERQLQLEEQALEASLERIKLASDEQFTGMRLSTSKLRRMMWKWHQELRPLIAKEQEHARQSIGCKWTRPMPSLLR